MRARNTFAISRDDGQKFVFLWHPGEEIRILEMALVMAGDSMHPFDLNDYANLAHGVSELSVPQGDKISELKSKFDKLWKGPK